MVSNYPGYTGSTSGRRWVTANSQNLTRFAGPPQSRARRTVLTSSVTPGFLLIVLVVADDCFSGIAIAFPYCLICVRICRVVVADIQRAILFRTTSFAAKPLLRRGITRAGESPICENTIHNGIFFDDWFAY